MKKAVFKHPETLTKLITVSCPGSKVPIRGEANVEAELLGYANHGEKFEIYVKTVAGFYRIVGDQVTNKRITLTCQCVSSLTDSHTYHFALVDTANSSYSLYALIKFLCAGIYE